MVIVFSALIPNSFVSKTGEHGLSDDTIWQGVPARAGGSQHLLSSPLAKRANDARFVGCASCVDSTRRLFFAKKLRYAAEAVHGAEKKTENFVLGVIDRGSASDRMLSLRPTGRQLPVGHVL